MFILFITERLDWVIKVSKVIFDGGYWIMEWKVSKSSKYDGFFETIKRVTFTKNDIRNKGIKTTSWNFITIK